MSTGTERMLVEFGKASLLQKARTQPDKVRQVIDKVRTDGLAATIEAVQSKLDQPLPLGYCNAGVVLESRAEGFAKGDRVVSNGNHAEVVRVSKNLCAKIPDSVDYDSAAFTVLGAIGLQGIRLLNPTLGEAVVVSGLGLIGLLCVQMLRANGCRVLGIDVHSERCELAQLFGADTVDLSKGVDPLSAANTFSRGRGVDGVIIAAAAEGDEIVHQAAQMCRKRGRIVLVGVVGLNLRRDDFFKKELSFQVSASYGPGRYDPRYEELGEDYPVGYVRWTEQRNFEAVLDMMATGSIDMKPLISHRFSIEQAGQAYRLLGDTAALGIMLEYAESADERIRSSYVQLRSQLHSGSGVSQSTGSDPVAGFIGAGNYASRVLMPAFKRAGASLDLVVTSSGVSGVHHGRKSEFRATSTDLGTLWKRSQVNLVAIVTRHADHADQVIAALQSGKHVFVEKPLALTLQQLADIDAAYTEVSQKSGPLLLMVGFNRRFAPHIVKMKSLLSPKAQPKAIIMTVNAGAIAAEHWTQDRRIGGGRIIGEACHFIDLMLFLVGSPIVGYQAMKIGSARGVEITDDKASITLSFMDGSIGTIHYLANGGRAFPKERIEVFCDGAVLQLDNYRRLTGFDWPGFRNMRLLKQDKGQDACAKAFVDAIRQGHESPIPYAELMESSRVSIEVANLLGSGPDGDV